MAALPDRDPLPRYLAPLPRPLEDLGLRLAMLIAGINLAGTAFGFWYYRIQFADTPPVMWPFVPDSPMATLFIALSLAAWRLDVDAGSIHVLAFFGCIKLGFWTPYVQLALNGPGGIALWLYVFLVVSHLAMVLEAFVIHRYAAFSLGSIAVALGWYGFNDVVDYFWPILEGPHHTWLRAEPFVMAGVPNHAVAAHDLAAACAVVLTVLATVLALATRKAKMNSQ
jgi:uncharacterized membrane protein YpjA